MNQFVGVEAQETGPNTEHREGSVLGSGESLQPTQDDVSTEATPTETSNRVECSQVGSEISSIKQDHVSQGEQFAKEVVGMGSSSGLATEVFPETSNGQQSVDNTDVDSNIDGSQCQSDVVYEIPAATTVSSIGALEYVWPSEPCNVEKVVCRLSAKKLIDRRRNGMTNPVATLSSYILREANIKINTKELVHILTDKWPEYFTLHSPGKKKDLTLVKLEVLSLIDTHRYGQLEITAQPQEYDGRWDNILPQSLLSQKSGSWYTHGRHHELSTISPGLFKTASNEQTAQGWPEMMHPGRTVSHKVHQFKPAVRDLIEEERRAFFERGPELLRGKITNDQQQNTSSAARIYGEQSRFGSMKIGATACITAPSIAVRLLQSSSPGSGFAMEGASRMYGSLLIDASNQEADMEAALDHVAQCQQVFVQICVDCFQIKDRADTLSEEEVRLLQRRFRVYQTPDEVVYRRGELAYVTFACPSVWSKNQYRQKSVYMIDTYRKMVADREALRHKALYLRRGETKCEVRINATNSEAVCSASRDEDQGLRYKTFNVLKHVAFLLEGPTDRNEFCKLTTRKPELIMYNSYEQVNFLRQQKPYPIQMCGILDLKYLLAEVKADKYDENTNLMALCYAETHVRVVQLHKKRFGNEEWVSNNIQLLQEMEDFLEENGLDELRENEATLKYQGGMGDSILKRPLPIRHAVEQRIKQIEQLYALLFKIIQKKIRPGESAQAKDSSQPS